MKQWGYRLTYDGNLGIRRQPWHSIPRNISQKRFECRASIFDHGPTDQRAHGYHDRQQQTHRPSRTRSGSTIGFGWRVLLENGTHGEGKDCIMVKMEGLPPTRSTYTICVYLQSWLVLRALEGSDDANLAGVKARTSAFLMAVV